MVIFNLIEGVSQESFYSLTKKMKDWLDVQPGFTKYEILSSDEGMCDILTYENQEAADRIINDFSKTEIYKEVVKCVLPGFHYFLGESVGL